MNSPLWQPSQDTIENSNLHQLMQVVANDQDTEFASYSEFYAWSVTQLADFWQAVWHDTGIIAHKTYDTVLIENTDMRQATWFSGCRLNFAQNLLRNNNNQEALVFRGELGQRVVYTYTQLHAAVSQFAQALKAMGVGKGCRVAGLLPNIPETVIAMLATSSLGAVWSSCSPDFGVSGIIDRFGQIKPKVLVTIDGYTFKGKSIQTLATVRQLQSEIASLEKVVVVPFLPQTIAQSANESMVLWNELLSQYQARDIDYTPVDFNDPLYIMFSSGTTGKPKCIVHGVGGTLIQHLKELKYHTNLQATDTILYYTTCGWMMWNWMISSLALGARVILYDGNPCYPEADSLLEILDEENVNIFGTSAKYIASIEKMGLEPKQKQHFQSLRTILSTGSPLSSENYDFVYQQIKSNLNLASISGGTDIISCFVLGNPLLPVYSGEIQCRGLGMDVAFFDEEGLEVKSEKGELVCRQAFPSMPLYFWNDPNQEKYNQAYFQRFPNVWAHGDYGELTRHGGVIIYGRSDAVLNPGGVRIGTAEIYRQVEKHNAVVECLAIGQEWHDDVRIVLFVVLKNSLQLTDDIKKEISHLIKSNTTPRHVPAVIIQVPELPRTISGKLVELAVREIIHNRPVKNSDALANPAVLEYFKELSELASPD